MARASTSVSTVGGSSATGIFLAEVESGFGPSPFVAPNWQAMMLPTNYTLEQALEDYSGPKPRYIDGIVRHMRICALDPAHKEIKVRIAIARHEGSEGHWPGYLIEYQYRGERKIWGRYTDNHQPQLGEIDSRNWSKHATDAAGALALWKKHHPDSPPPA